MKAIIMAAGRGTRMGDLTRDIPKPLLKIKGKALIERTLEALPVEISEIIIVVGYRGDQIKSHVGDLWGGKKIVYTNQNENMHGTCGAVWSAREFVGHERFLVVSGDDVYSKEDLEELIKPNISLGIHKSPSQGEQVFDIIADENGNLKQFGRPMPEQKTINIAVGAYVLDQNIFSCSPFQLKNGEYSLPQTILNMAKDFPVRCVDMKFWVQINSPADIQKAEELI